MQQMGDWPSPATEARRIGLDLKTYSRTSINLLTGHLRGTILHV